MRRSGPLLPFPVVALIQISSWRYKCYNQYALTRLYSDVQKAVSEERFPRTMGEERALFPALRVSLFFEYTSWHYQVFKKGVVYHHLVLVLATSMPLHLIIVHPENYVAMFAAVHVRI